MTSIWKKPTFSPRQQELKWLNLIWESHDQMCSCQDPPLHLMILINKDSNAPKPESDIKNLKCLLTGTDTTIKENIENEDPIFDEGELERLFAEDGGKGDTEEEER